MSTLSVVPRSSPNAADVAYFCGQTQASKQVALELSDYQGLSLQAARLRREWAGRHVVQATLIGRRSAVNGLVGPREASAAVRAHEQEFVAGRRSILVVFALALADEQDGWAGRELAERMGTWWPHEDDRWPWLEGLTRAEQVWASPETERAAHYLLHEKLRVARQAANLDEAVRLVGRPERRVLRWLRVAPKAGDDLGQEPLDRQEAARHREQLDQLVDDVPREAGDAA